MIIAKGVQNPPEIEFTAWNPSIDLMGCQRVIAGWKGIKDLTVEEDLVLRIETHWSQVLLVKPNEVIFRYVDGTVFFTHDPGSFSKKFTMVGAK